MLADTNANTQSLGGHRPRLTSAERRSAIVRAAIELFAQKGFRGTTTRELASAVGVTEPVLYHHFATKRELYTAIVDQMVQEASKDFELSSCRLENGRALSDRQFFECLGEIILNWYRDKSEQIRLLLFSALEGHDLAEIWHEKATMQLMALVEGHIKRRTTEGRYRKVDSQVAARALIGMVAHYGLVSTLFGIREIPLERNEVIAEFVDIFLRGIGRTEPAGEGQGE